MVNTYMSMRMCSNCRNIIKLRIPVGITFEEFMKDNEKCPVCGCNLMEKNYAVE